MFCRVESHSFVIMPDHVHLRIHIRAGTREPLKSIGMFVNNFKRWTKWKAAKLGVNIDWQPNYHDRLCLNAEVIDLVDKYIANNIPVYIGEYGCVMHTSDRSNVFRSYYLEYVCRAAHTYHMPLCIWDNNVTGGGNEHHGYFNHNDGTYLNNAENLVKTMIKAATSDDSSYTLETIYNNAPK